MRSMELQDIYPEEVLNDLGLLFMDFIIEYFPFHHLDCYGNTLHDRENLTNFEINCN